MQRYERRVVLPLICSDVGAGKSRPDRQVLLSFLKSDGYGHEH